MRGTVVRWGLKGFGFIQSPELPVQAYFNQHCIAALNYWPKEQDDVEFEPFWRPDDRVEARQVRPVRPAIAAAPPPAPPAPEPRKLTPEPTPPRRLDLAALLDKLRKQHRRDAENLETEKTAQAAAAAQFAAAVEEARRALEKAENQSRRAAEDLGMIESRILSLPELQALEKNEEIDRYIKTLRDDAAALLADRFELLDRIHKTRAAEPEAAYYDRARKEAASGDEVERRAFAMLEKELRSKLPDYAAAVDRLDALPEAALPVLLFRAALVFPIPFEPRHLKPAAAFVEAVCHSRGDIATARLGVCAGSLAATLDSTDPEMIALSLEDAFHSREALRAVKLKPALEVVDLDATLTDQVPLLEPPQDPRPRLAVAEGVAEMAERLGLPRHAVIAHLVHFKLPFPDDRIDEGTARSLLQLLGIPIAEAPAAPPAAEETDGAGLRSVEEALDRIAREFPDRIALRPNSQSEVRDNPFEDAPAVYRALRFLATRYYEARCGRAPCADFDTPLRLASGFWHRPMQSEVTMGRFSNHYETDWNGRKVPLKEHIGRSDSRDPRHALRIAYYWDEDARAIVIGYVGQHQRTAVT